MNKLTQFFLVLFMICLPATLWADNDKDDDDSRYLAGAVPEVDGRVVFSREFSIPGMSQDEIYERMLKWLDGRMAQNKNNSRVVYKDQGVIAATGEEWLVFSSTALSLDRTWLTYQITVNCQPQKCTMEIEKIRYTYREKEKYTAEEWITDKFALNKTKTKLVRGLAKWRRKTVDFADNLFEEAAKALSQKPQEAAAAEAVPKKPAVVTAPKVVVIGGEKETEKVEKAATVTPAIPVTPPSTMPGYKEVAPDQVPANAIQMGAGRLVIAIGSDPFNMTMMTANAGGSIGKISGSPVVFSILSPDQPYEQLEKAETYSIRFYPTGQSEPSVILECQKLPAPTPMEGQPRTYAGKITKAFMK